MRTKDEEAYSMTVGDLIGVKDMTIKQMITVLRS